MITVDRLTKTYGDHPAVDSLSFSVQPGRVTGLVGPNGSGQSTTMRMMVGLTRPDTGNEAVARQGIDVHSREIAVLDVELAKVEAAVERYVLAFENGTVTEAAFGPRVHELGAQAELLRARREEATSALQRAAGAKTPTLGTCGQFTRCSERPPARVTTRCASPSPRPSSPSFLSRPVTASCRASGCWPKCPMEDSPEDRCSYNDTCSGAEGNRTPDLHHAMVALYQLSYSPGAPQLTSGPSEIPTARDRSAP